MSVKGVKLEKGDNVRYLGGDPAENKNLTQGKVYEISDVFPYEGNYVEYGFTDDYEDRWCIGEELENTHAFERVEESNEPDPTETELEDLKNNNWTLEQENGYLSETINRLEDDVSRLNHKIKNQDKLIDTLIKHIKEVDDQ